MTVGKIQSLIFSPDVNPGDGGPYNYNNYHHPNNYNANFHPGEPNLEQQQQPNGDLMELDVINGVSSSKTSPSSPSHPGPGSSPSKPKPKTEPGLERGIAGITNRISTISSPDSGNIMRGATSTNPNQEKENVSKLRLFLVSDAYSIRK